MKFEEIYTEYFSDVYRYILRLSGDEHLAEEITSEAFFAALSSLDKFRGESEVRVWLCGIAKNCYYQHLKKKKPIVSIDDDTLGEIPDESADVGEHAADRSHAEQIRRIWLVREATASRISECFAVVVAVGSGTQKGGGNITKMFHKAQSIPLGILNICFFKLCAKLTVCHFIPPFFLCPLTYYHRMAKKGIDF